MAFACTFRTLYSLGFLGKKESLDEDALHVARRLLQRLEAHLRGSLLEEERDEGSHVEVDAAVAESLEEVGATRIQRILLPLPLKHILTG